MAQRFNSGLKLSCGRHPAKALASNAVSKVWNMMEYVLGYVACEHLARNKRLVERMDQSYFYTVAVGLKYISVYSADKSVNIHTDIFPPLRV